MALVTANRVQETTATTGTGTLTLAGASTQFQSFSAGIGTGNQCAFCILAGNGSDWEVSLGTVTVSGGTTTLSRDTLLESSTGSKLSLTGTSTVFITQPAYATSGPPLVKPPLLANWTQRNVSSPAAAADSPLGVVLTDTFGTGPRIRALTIAAPGTPYTIDALVAMDADYTNFAGAGICFTDGTKYQAFFVGLSTTPQNRVSGFTNATTFSADSTTAQNWFFNPYAVWLRIADDGTNVSFSHSADGVNWNLRYSVAKASGFLGSGGYTNVGLWLDVEGTAQAGTTQNCSATLRSWWQH